MHMFLEKIKWLHRFEWSIIEHLALLFFLLQQVLTQLLKEAGYSRDSYLMLDDFIKVLYILSYIYYNYSLRNLIKTSFHPWLTIFKWLFYHSWLTILRWLVCFCFPLSLCVSLVYIHKCTMVISYLLENGTQDDPFHKVLIILT